MLTYLTILMAKQTKLLAILLLLSVLTLQQGEIIESSGKDASVLATKGDTSDLPSAAPSIATSTGNLVAGKAILPTAPADFNFVYAKSLSGSSSWIFPEGYFQMYPRYYLAKYTITVNTDCPQAGVVLTIAGTGNVFVFNQGASYWELIWGSPWPTTHTVNIPGSRLKCGCNTLVVYVYNYYYPSPAALIYSFSQNTSNCYNCTNLGVTFYNRKTCRCECAAPACVCPRNMDWFNYPACGCACRRSIPCDKGYYFNNQTCNCQCIPKCCPVGFYQDPKNCECVRAITINPWLAVPDNNGGTVSLDSQLSATP